MAQVDTGLGWSMKDTYAMVATGIFGGYHAMVPQSPITGQPIPHVAGQSELGQMGYVYNESINTDKTGALTDDDVFVFYYTIAENQHAFVWVSATPNARYCTGIKSGTTGIIVYREYTISTYHSASGLYYRSSTGSGAVGPQCPQFASLNDGMNYFSVISTDIYKLNSGYAVACFVKWKDFAPSTYWTPVLISTDENAVALSIDGVTEYPNAAKAIQRYDGMTFYVSYIRGLDGDPTTSYPTFDANAEFIGPGGEMLSLNNVFALIASSEHANILVNETVDPYAPFGNTEEGGGEVDSDPEDDDVEEPTLPGLSFAATGLCRIYRADLIALNQLANYMWTDDTFLQTLINHAIQLIENPMDAIISLCLVPVAPPAFSVGAAEAVSVMYIPTPAAMWPVVNQFARVDCGTLDLKETYGSALDYNPYTKVSCFLPYIGFVDLDTDEVMGKTLNVVYRIDVVSGVCVAMIKVDGEVMYQFSGHCAIQMPLSSADFSTVISSLLQAGKLVAGAALTAAGAPEVGGMLLDAPQVSQPSTTVRKMVGTERNPNTGRQITTGTVTETVEKTGKPLALGELAKRQSANTVGAIMNSKFGIEHSGGFSGNSGYLGVRRPFIIVKRPRLANPEQYGQYNGRPSMIYLNLGTCTGYTEVQSIQLTGIAATNSELSEIATLLKTGVIL